MRLINDRMEAQSKADLVNPPPEQGHWKAFAIARRYRFLFMTYTAIFGATGSPQTVLRPMAQ